MAFNYSGNPADSDLDAVRYLIGDTNESDHILEDAEIQYEIDNESSVIDAAINAINGIIAEVAKKADAVQAEEISAEYSDQVNRYIQVRNELKKRKVSQGKNMGQLDDNSVLWGQDTEPIFSVDQFTNETQF